jgi:hypothetical protein
MPNEVVENPTYPRFIDHIIGIVNEIPLLRRMRAIEILFFLRSQYRHQMRLLGRGFSVSMI